jgi:hypothetical protein
MNSPLDLSPLKAVHRSPIKVVTTDEKKRKPHYCLYCSEDKSSNIWQHLRLKHKNEAEVIAANEAKDRMTKSAMFGKLIARGDEKHNMATISKVAGNVVPAKRSAAINGGRRSRLVKCHYCVKYFNFNNFNKRHLRKCKAKYSNSPLKKSPQKGTVMNLSDISNASNLNLPVSKSASAHLKNVKFILHRMKDKNKDIENFLYRPDETIVCYVQLIFILQESGNNKLPIIRRNIRLMYNLMENFSKDPAVGSEVVKLRDICRRSVWQGTTENMPDFSAPDRIVSIVLELCGGDANSPTFQKPNDIMSYSSMLRQLATEVKYTRFASNEERIKWVEECDGLIGYLDSLRWRNYTTRRAGLQKRNEQKLQKIFVDADDLAKYRIKLEENVKASFADLKEAYTKRDKIAANAAYFRLARLHLLLFGLFNARRASEPGYITLENYNDRNNFSKSHCNLMTEVQQQLAQRFDIFTSKGKGSQKVMSLSKLEWRPYLEWLTDPAVRKFAGVAETCKYMYGSASPDRPLDFAKMQQTIAHSCGAKNPNEIRARFIRTTFATTIGKLSLSYPARKMICLLMGHKMDVHDSYYDLPTGLGFGLMVGRALEIFSDGKILQYDGKTLESEAGITKEVISAPVNPEDE